MTDLEFRMLGPFEVLRGGDLVNLGPGRARALLAMLLVHANQVVATDHLLEELWAGEPPATAPHALQVHVSSLRKLIGPDAIVTRRPGYLLAVASDGCDAARFESLLAAGGRALEANRAGDALSVLDEALALWRGPVLADLADEPFVQAQATRLEELRLVATERRVEAGLALGHHGELVGELEGLVRRYPLRESLWARLIIALYRSGRQADALRAYQRLREVLAEELGLEPSPELRRLEGMVLRQDRELAPPAVPEVAREAEEVPSEPESGPAPAAAGEGVAVDEVRVVTALFADLVGSTPLAEQLAPEELSLIVNGAVERMESCVEALGGTVTSRMGDGILALFGDRVAHEDDQERAVRAGLRILEEVAAYGEEVARSWAVDPLVSRVGIDTGPVVVGSPDAQVLGDALNTAARLQGAAPPGSALVSAAVRQLTAALFEWGEPRALSLKGKTGPVEAVEVLAARPVPGKVRGLEGLRPPLVGRESEMATAGRMVEALMAGTGGVLVVTGDAGTGKSRLLTELRELVERFAGTGLRPLWLEGRCLSWGGSLVYGPFRELLREWLGASPTHPALRTRVTLRHKVGGRLFGTGAAEVAGFLSSVLGVPLEPEAAERLAALPPEAIRQGAFGAVRDLLDRLAGTGPVVVALDDLHWADATSLQLVQHLLPVADSAAALLVLAMRPEREHGSWRVREMAQREMAYRTREVALEALPVGAGARLLDELLGPGTLPAGVATDLLEAAAGNPLFIEELVRSLMDAGALRRGPDGWEVTGDLPVEVPRRVESVLASRLDRLPGAERAVLGAAAVLGRQFPLAVLAQVCEEEADLERALGDLQQLELIELARRWPAVEYRFRHPLIAETAYRRLVADRRRALHRRAAEALQTLFPDRLAESYGVLAHHHEQAGDVPRAVAYHHLAADAARRDDALAEAARHWTAALDLIESLPASEARRHRPVLELGRGRAWWYLADGRAGDELRRALASARAAGDGATELGALQDLVSVEAHVEGRTGTARLDEALAAAVRLGDVAAEVSVRNRLTVVLANGLDLAGALASGEKALAAGRRTGDEALAGRALDGLKLVAFVLGDWPGLRELAEELETILRRHDDRWYLQYLLAESAYAWAGGGDWEGAWARLDEAQAVNAGLGDRFTLPYLLTLRAWLERARGGLDDALALGQDAARAAADGRNTQWVAWSETNLGAILAEAGSPEEAIGHLEAGREAAVRGGVRIQAVRAAAHLARARLAVGDRPAAGREMATAEEILDAVTCPPGMHFLYGLDAYLALADVRLVLGDLDGVAPRLGPLLAAATSVGWNEGVARTALVLARGAAASGQADEARSLAHQALEAAGEGAVPALAAEARRLLDAGSDE